MVKFTAKGGLAVTRYHYRRSKPRLRKVSRIMEELDEETTRVDEEVIKEQARRIKLLMGESGR